MRRRWRMGLRLWLWIKRCAQRVLDTGWAHTAVATQDQLMAALQAR